MADFDHLTTDILKFWPWSWSKIFDHLTMTPGRGPNGQKIMVILPPPPPPLITAMGLTNKNFPQAFYIMIEDSRLRMFCTTVMNGYSLHGMLY